MSTAKKPKAKAKTAAKAKTRGPTPLHRVFAYKTAKIYSLLVQKAERKNRTKREVDQIICWLTGYTPAGLQKQIRGDGELGAFLEDAPAFNPAAKLIKGKVCGVQVEEIADPLMRKVRYLDKLIDELAQGKAMEKILRKDA